MGSDAADQFGNIPMSAKLAQSLMRAADYAREMSHAEIRLEHLLLSLTEDEDAQSILRSSHIDIARLKSDVSSHLGAISEFQPGGAPATTSVSESLKRILEAASAAAKGRRSEINGAIVLAAIVGEGNNAAAHILSGQGLTFEATIRALQQMAEAPSAEAPGPTAPPAAPAPPHLQASQPPRQRPTENDRQPVQAGQVPMNASPHADTAASQGARSEAAIASSASLAAEQSGEAGPAPGGGVESILAQARQSIRDRSGRQPPNRPAAKAGTPTTGNNEAAGPDPAVAPPAAAGQGRGSIAHAAPVSAQGQAQAPGQGQAQGKPPAPEPDETNQQPAVPEIPVTTTAAAVSAPLNSGPDGPANAPSASEVGELDLPLKADKAERGLASLQTASPRTTPLKPPLAVPPQPAPPAAAHLPESRPEIPGRSNETRGGDSIPATPGGHASDQTAQRPETPPSVHGSYRLPESPRPVGDGRPVSPRPRPFPRLPDRPAPQRPDIPGRGPQHGASQPASASAPPAPAQTANTVRPPSPPHQPQNPSVYNATTAGTRQQGPAMPAAAGMTGHNRPTLATTAPNWTPPDGQARRNPPPPNFRPDANFPPRPPAPPPDPATGQPFRPAGALGQQGQPAPTPIQQPPRQQPPGQQPQRQSPSVSGAGGIARPTVALEPCTPEDLLEAIPRRMRVGKPASVELRLRPGQLLTLADADAGRPASLTLRLRAPGGDAVVETVSGETQWANIQRTGSGDDHIVWRWTVTPKNSGRKPLKIAIVARTVGTDALMIERTLPSQIKEVRIAPNLAAGLSATLKSLIAFTLGAGAVLFAEPIWFYVRTTLETLGLR